MNRYVIYTTIVGGYDIVKQPVVTDDRFDYILFTDDVSKPKIGIWQVRPIPYKEHDQFLLSRYPKIMSTKVLPEYEASLYIDGTLQILTSFVYDRFIELCNYCADWAGVKHYYRDCVYDEMCGIVGEFPKNVHDYETIDWYAFLKNEGFPEHFGLYENNVIFRRHTPLIEKINYEWWNSMLTYCRRDQFSLMYFLWKYSPSCSLFFANGDDAKHSEHFKYYYHAYLRKQTQLTLNEKVRIHCWRSSPWKNNWYGYVMEQCYNITPWPKMSLIVWEFYAVCLYWAPHKIKRLWLKYISRKFPYEN